MFKESENGQTHFCSECERLSRENIKKDKIIDRMANNIIVSSIGMGFITTRDVVNYYTRNFRK